MATAWAFSGILLLALQAPPEVPPAEDALNPDQMRHREMTVMATVSTVVFAEKQYAAANGSFFDEIPCLTDPARCIPGFDAGAAPFLDPTYAWLEPRLGYTARSTRARRRMRPRRRPRRRSQASVAVDRGLRVHGDAAEAGRLGRPRVLRGLDRPDVHDEERQPAAGQGRALRALPEDPIAAHSAS